MPHPIARIAFALLLVATSSCVNKDTKKAAPPYPHTPLTREGKVIATVGPVTFTTAEMEKRINRQSPFMRERFTDLKHRHTFVQNEVRFELLAQEAWRRGMYDDPQIIGELKKALVQRLVRNETVKLDKQITVEEAELRTEYVRRRAEYNRPEKIRLSQIVLYVKNKAERQQAHTLLAKARQEIIDAERKNVTGTFTEKCRKLSQDEHTRRAGGDLQFMTAAELKERYGEAVSTRMFKTAKVGDSVIADADNAVVLFKKTGRRRAVERTLEMVKAQLRAKIMQEKRNKGFTSFVDALQKKHGVNLDDKALEAIKLDLSAPTAPDKHP